MANIEPGIDSGGDRFANQANEFVESVAELQELPMSEQDRITDLIAMTLEDMEHRLTEEPVGSGYYMGVALTILEDQERVVRARGEKQPEGVITDLHWFSDPREIEHLAQYQQ